MKRANTTSMKTLSYQSANIFKNCKQTVRLNRNSANADSGTTGF